MKQVLHSVCNDPTLNFWRVIYGNLLDMAVLEWCKLFGSDDEERQPVHWKNIIRESDHDVFRAGLYSQLNMNEEEWLEYWSTIKTYRDKAVAHFDIKKRDVTHYPVLNSALEASYYYYGYFVDELRSAGFVGYPEDIRDYCDKFVGQTVKVAECALRATSSIEEKVK